jgi:hypothetical protein
MVNIFNSYKLIHLVYAFNIDLTFDTFYFLLKDENGESYIRGLDVCKNSEISFEQSRVERPDYKFNLFFYQNIKNKGKFFKD